MTKGETLLIERLKAAVELLDQSEKLAMTDEISIRLHAAVGKARAEATEALDHAELEIIERVYT